MCETSAPNSWNQIRIRVENYAKRKARGGISRVASIKSLSESSEMRWVSSPVQRVVGHHRLNPWVKWQNWHEVIFQIAVIEHISETVLIDYATWWMSSIHCIHLCQVDANGRNVSATLGIGTLVILGFCDDEQIDGRGINHVPCAPSKLILSRDEKWIWCLICVCTEQSSIDLLSLCTIWCEWMAFRTDLRRFWLPNRCMRCRFLPEYYWK